jgi:hypothetical protein
MHRLVAGNLFPSVLGEKEILEAFESCIIDPKECKISICKSCGERCTIEDFGNTNIENETLELLVGSLHTGAVVCKTCESQIVKNSVPRISKVYVSLGRCFPCLKNFL